jgi:hypothetical protein
MAKAIQEWECSQWPWEYSQLHDIGSAPNIMGSAQSPMAVAIQDCHVCKVGSHSSGLARKFRCLNAGDQSTEDWRETDKLTGSEKTSAQNAMLQKWVYDKNLATTEKEKCKLIRSASLIGRARQGGGNHTQTRLNCCSKLHKFKS